MPEGPEAHTIARKLAEQISGLIIVDVEILQGSKHADMDKINLPLMIKDVRAHGKRPIIVTNDGVISVFLAMTGSLTWKPTSHPRIILTLSEGRRNGRLFILEGDSLKLYFNDTRPFGKVHYLKDQASIDAHFKPFGVDLISTQITSEHFTSVLRQAPSDWEVCKYLLTPKYLCSIGNYVKSEILYLSKIRPDRTLSSLSDNDCNVLYQATMWVLKTSLVKGGLTISDYVHPDGSVGTYSPIVYMRLQDPNSLPVITSKFTDGRTTHWVPDYQV